jgi:multimeric flavodoxin WrbA
MVNGMFVLGIYGSPRRGGNTSQLLDKALQGAESAGAETRKIYVRALKMSGCIECGGCDKTGKCVVEDDMQEIYPLLEAADVIFVASPIFFYGVTAQLKAVIDRSQALWSKRMLTKTGEQRKHHDGGKGFFISAAATRGKKIFEGAELEVKYFFDALDMSYEEGLLVRGLEKRKDVQRQPSLLDQAFKLGRDAVREDAHSDSPA